MHTPPYKDLIEGNYSADSISPFEIRTTWEKNMFGTFSFSFDVTKNQNVYFSQWIEKQAKITTI